MWGLQLHEGRPGPGISGSSAARDGRSVIQALIVAVICVIAGTFVVGLFVPNGGIDQLDLKVALQRTALRWLSVMASSIVGAFQLPTIVDSIVKAL